MRSEMEGARLEREEAVDELRKLRRELESQKLRFQSELAAQQAIIELELNAKDKAVDDLPPMEIQIPFPEPELPTADVHSDGGSGRAYVAKDRLWGAGPILDAAEDELEYNAPRLSPHLIDGKIPRVELDVYFASWSACTQESTRQHTAVSQ